MEIWVLESAFEKIRVLKSLEKKGKGIIFGHKRGDSFIVEDLIPLKKCNLKVRNSILSIISKPDFLGFFSMEENGLENLQEPLYGFVILKITKRKIKGFIIEITERNKTKTIELPVKVFSQEGKNERKSKENIAKNCKGFNKGISKNQETNYTKS